MWYIWESKEKFDIWHKKLCLELGFPKNNTTAYTFPCVINDFVIAYVENEYNEGLVATELRPPTIINNPVISNVV